MKETKRALRRHHRQRLIAQTLRFVTAWDWLEDEQERLEKVLRLYNNKQACACWMCRNPRKWEGPTLQERRQLAASDVNCQNRARYTAPQTDGLSE